MHRLKINRLKLGNYFHVGIIFCLLFSSLAFYQTVREAWYIAIVALITVITIIKCIYNPSILKKLILHRSYNKYFLWLATLFLFYVLHNYFLYPKNSPLGKVDFISQFLITFIIIIWTLNLEFKQALRCLTIAGALASIAMLFYLFTTGITSFLAEAMTGYTRLGKENDYIRNMNYVTLLVLLFSAFSLYYAFYSSQKKFFLFLFFFQVCLILLSGSKKAFLGAVMIFVGLYFLKYGRKIFKYVIPLSFTMFLVLYLLLHNTFLYNVIGYRLEAGLAVIGFEIENSQLEQTALNSDNLRIELLEKAIEMSSDIPLLGKGFAYFQTHTIGFNSINHVYHSHNNYLELYINYGIIGFLLYYSMYIYTFLKILFKRKEPLGYVFIIFFIVLFFILEPTIVSFYMSPCIYLFLYMSYRYLLEKLDEVRN